MRKNWLRLIAVLYLVLGAAYGADRLLLTDAATGFSVEPYWLRYGIMAAALLALLPLAMAIPGKSPAETPGSGYRWLALLAGCGFAACGAAYALAGKEVQYKLLGILQLGSAIWLLAVFLRRSVGSTEPPTQGALPGIAATLSLYMLVPVRFMVHQTGIVRVGPTVQILSALAALVFAVCHLRLVQIPQFSSSRMVCASGMAAFLFCTCLEGSGMLAQWLQQEAEATELLCAAAMACVGLLGLYCAQAQYSGRTKQI